MIKSSIEKISENTNKEGESLQGQKIELTEEEIQEKVSRLGDIDELAEKVESPFTSGTIKALARLVVKLERDLPIYDTILSDDTSGRLPSLFLRKIIDRVRSKTGQVSVKTYFLAAGNNDNPAKDEAVKNFLSGKKEEIGKALLVTEYMDRGNTIMNIMELLAGIGINFDVACVSARDEAESYIQDKGDIFKKVRYGEEPSTEGLLFWHKERISGVRKDDDNPSPHPEIVSSGDKGRLIQARKDISFLAEEFINKLLD